MAIVRSRGVVLATLLIITVSATPGSGDDAVSAAALFERAETLYAQLRAVDPACADPAAWQALAQAFAEVPLRYPGSDVAGEAFWRIGDIQSRRHTVGAADAAAAREAYVSLVDQYPDSPRTPAALLRLAELTPPPHRRDIYAQVVAEHAQSPEAEVAREALAGNVADERAASPLATSGSLSDAFSNQVLADEELEAAPTPASGSASAGSVADELSTSAFVLGRIRGLRHYSDDKHTRVVFDLDRALRYEVGEVADPPRVFLDLIGAELAAGVPETSDVDGTGVKRIRFGENRPGVVRVVLDLQASGPYSLFHLEDPHRLVIDVPSAEMSRRLATARRPPAPEGGGEARQLALGFRRVVIDPGHGGTAPGAIGRTGIVEKDLTLDISKRLADNLRRSGYEVVLTREGDQTVELEERPHFATQAGGDLFVSIHINSANNRKLAGFETYYLDLATDPTAAETAARENAASAVGMANLEDLLDQIVKNANKRESRDLAQSVQDSLVLQMSKSFDDVRDLGVKHAPFIVLVGAHMPAVLVECSFVSNPEEEQRLRQPEYRQQLADAIHIGIENFAARRRMLATSR